MSQSGALIIEVEKESPADDAGFIPGCRVLSVDGKPVRDMIDWQWLSAADSLEIGYVDTDGEEGVVDIDREPGEYWGFRFDGEIFDEVKTCRNACTFCFMRQLPDDVRPSLSLRDDDFRLSFFQGTFITATNITLEDEARILEQRISPLRVSLHAISPAVREGLIGRYADHGLAVCKRLLASGIEMHMQIVLVPGVNDGAELVRTLEWAYATAGVLSVGVVPLGFTKHQSCFDHSFNNPDAARRVLQDLEPFQIRAWRERNFPWVYGADEFYRNAYPVDLLEHLPKQPFYGDYDMFEDGIGIIRSTVDSWEESVDLQQQLAAKLTRENTQVRYVIGYAQKEFLEPLLEKSPLQGLFLPFPVRNEYFGGNVDVTGLLCGVDIIEALQKTFGADANTAAFAESAATANADRPLVVIPKVIFNADGVTLDDMSLEDMQNASPVRLAVVSCNPSDYLEEIATLIP